eukprot:CAMPEP_0115195160 /NCGR_PEP_ID=MMETSP0270-20121206/14438_1 /TAXON_ID=71861 /ORGANISM="Scrippsiella trochoidea, Strain CCMP3099" /LENGTH=132 /DNA_ID=CAMNT_0002608475 /DNA_START=327 /DNA_END=727 /DNA_ORIENTATION=-
MPMSRRTTTGASTSVGGAIPGTRRIWHRSVTATVDPRNVADEKAATCLRAVERVATRCLAPESASPEALDVEDDDDLEANSFAGRGGCGGATASGSRVTALLKPSGFELLDAEPVATGSGGQLDHASEDSPF